MEQFFATCPRGLENLLLADLSAAGGRDLQVTPGGVHFRGDWPVCHHANLHSRIAARILWRVGHGTYAREDDIYRLALGVPWPRSFAPERTLRVDVTAVKSPLKSLEFITLRIKDAVCDRFRQECGARPSIDTRTPDVRVQAFLTADTCTLYLDTSGEPLWQRGYRQKTVEAPLKENLAAGILRLAGWKPGTTLLDPMCGSGTFLLEAAQMALGIAPGLGREFAFSRFLHHDRAAWQKLLTAAAAARQPAAAMGIYGSDSAAQAVRAAQANLDRAGLLPAVQLQTVDLLQRAAPADSGILICNPPYGVRLEEQEQLASFYPQLAAALKRNFAGWNCFFFTADLRLPKLMRLAPGRKTPLYNGPLECRLFEFVMVAGSNRRQERKADTAND